MSGAIESPEEARRNLRPLQAIRVTAFLPPKLSRSSMRNDRAG
jgi:hypothetical protein